MASIMGKTEEIWRIAERNLFDDGGIVILEILESLENF
jgi:hypothetical protein